MGNIVSMVGVFGALMGLFGSIVSLFMGGVGVLAGADEAGPQVTRGLGAIAVSLVGVVGALAARRRLGGGSLVLGVSALAGLLLVPLFYAVGAVLMLTGSILGLLEVRGGGRNKGVE